MAIVRQESQRDQLRRRVPRLTPEERIHDLAPHALSQTASPAHTRRENRQTTWRLKDSRVPERDRSLRASDTVAERDFQNITVPPKSYLCRELRRGYYRAQ